MQLFRTADGGDTWVQIPSAPAGSITCGGIGFVKAVPVLSSGRVMIGVTLYFSSRCGLARLRCLRNPLRNQVIYTGSWEGLASDHGDTRDLAFRDLGGLRGRIDPYLLGTDGGVHTTVDGGANWTFVGGGRGGFNALQITEVFGQTIDDVGRHDLYYGTQDNNLYASGDGGASWGNSQCCEGFFIDSVRRVARAADAKITSFWIGSGNNISDSLFVNPKAWSNVPGGVSSPRALGEKRHVQGVGAGPMFSAGFAVTTDLGASWVQFAKFTESQLDLPKVSDSRGPLRSFGGTVLYQAIRGSPNDHLVRLFKSPFIRGEAVVHYPAMTGFGGLGINPTMFAWYEVFGVNPKDPNHLIAPDIVNDRVMRTQDGGETWADMTELTRLVTDNGRLRFRDGRFPIVSAVSYCPDNPSLVMVGTAEGGVFVSADMGTTWGRVPGSERATLVSSIHWRTANDVVVSTYGRGLWRLTNQLVIRISDLERWCRKPCEFWRFIDCLADGLTGAVRDAVGDGARAALKDLLVDALADPETLATLRRVLVPDWVAHPAGPTPATRTAAFLARVRAAATGAAMACARTATAGLMAVAVRVRRGWSAARRAVGAAASALALARQLKAAAVVGLGLGLAAVVVALVSHPAAVVLSGVGAAAAGFAAHLGLWARRVARRLKG